MSISFNGGSAQQQDLIRQAHDKAQKLVAEAASAAATSVDFPGWFGTGSRTTVGQTLNTMSARLASDTFLYDFAPMTSAQPTPELLLCTGSESAPGRTVFVPCQPLFLQTSLDLAIIKAALSIVQLVAQACTQAETVMAADKTGARYLADHAPDLATASPTNYRYFVEALTLSDLPIGTVTTFAGDLSIPAILKVVNDAGWLLCDGSARSSSEYPDLFDAIGTANGGDAINFRLPDLRSRFPRGTANATNGTDPDTATRVAAAAGGAIGSNTGSLQKSATALPNAPWLLQADGLHAHSCQHLNADMHMAWSGSTYTMARWNAPAQTDNAGAHFHGVTGFDDSTTPISVALYFIIKADEPKVPTGSVPAGAIAAFGGPLAAVPVKWLKCDGTAYGTSRFPNLFNTVFYNFGGDGQSVVNTPDLRGYFLRGTNHATNRDPNAGNRHALHTGGNTGDAVGSAQLHATATPGALAVSSVGDHSHNIARIPLTDHHAAWGASGPAAYNCMVWTNDTTTSSQAGEHNHAITGGDRETRPENIYVDFLVASDVLTQSAPPIGTVMSYGGDTTDPGIKAALMASGWLPCDGSLVRISAFQALYGAIGTVFGSAPLKFAVPDLRGYFIAGAGRIPVGTVQSVSTTGHPANPVISTTDGGHSHSMPNVPTDTHVIDVVMGVDLAENNPNGSPTSGSGTHTHAIAGGDPESRPINVYVDYVIRFR
ncbi:hypothetical protein P350_35760 [Burkholderia cepacia JBK9]|uniref:tail fiber protein n=1 Tax=Burkholderia arboris TaxID=488730 RepID=UPI000740A5FA|nr:tail fiber protein [Burkholderia arboris]ALX16980.1 hypothetical protein P350_35760 [Burkholderia cepacia JBK9]MCA8489125.1 phage tail protein [Burkholderia arboris]